VVCNFLIRYFLSAALSRARLLFLVKLLTGEVIVQLNVVIKNIIDASLIRLTQSVMTVNLWILLNVRLHIRGVRAMLSLIELLELAVIKCFNPKELVDSFTWVEILLHVIQSVLTSTLLLNFRLAICGCILTFKPS
jgi:hypothetical protein